MVDGGKPPREGDEIYVASTQVYGRVLEVGAQTGRRHGIPMYHVLFERKGKIRDGLVFRQGKRVYLGKDLGVKGQQFDNGRND